MSVKAINKTEFENEVINSGKTCIVDFWAGWCSPCMMLAPTIEELSEQFSDIDFFKINIDEFPELAMEYKIMSIPTVMLFKNGEAKSKLVGLRDKSEYEEMIER